MDPFPTEPGTVVVNPVNPATSSYELYNENNELISSIPEDEIIYLDVSEAPKLSDEDQEAFIAAFEDARAIEDMVVHDFYWFDIPEEYKTEDFSWLKYEFNCAGELVEVTVNGNPMEVVHVDGEEYYAKLTEFGAVAIMSD